MKYDTIIDLRNNAIRAYVGLDEAKDRLQSHIAGLQTPEAKKKFSAGHLMQSSLDAKAEAKQAARFVESNLTAMQKDIETGRRAWDTSTLLRQSRFVEGDDINSQLLEEMKRIRYGQEIASMEHAELLTALDEAASSKNLPLLSMLTREAGHRKPDDAVARVGLQSAVRDALEAVEIRGQKQALAALDAAAAEVEAVEDLFVELVEGTEPERARMKRIMAKQAQQA